MQNKDCVFVLSIYKETMNNYEIVSFSRLCKLMGNKYDIYVNTYEELNVTQYINIANKYGVTLNLIYWNKTLFTSVWGYSLLVTNQWMYKLFREYKYIFIYQLDCYIFKDTLDYWIAQDLNQIECINILYLASGKNLFHFNGQGLRKISACLDVFDTHYEELNNLKNNIITLKRMHDNGDALEEYNLMYLCGEDMFFTKYLSNDLIKEEYFYFGWSAYFNEQLGLLDKYGYPMIIHNFNKDVDWILNVIGNPDEDLEGCINKTFE